MSVAAAPSRRRRRRWLAVAVVAALLGTAFGCTSTITPPPAPTDPTTVFLLREAMHTGIVLPGDPGSDGYVEFGFGDWNWYALGNDAWYQVFPTVLWPTQGALGRRAFGTHAAAGLPAAAYWAEVQPLVVSSARAAALRQRLQNLFDAGAAQEVRRDDLRFRFVPFASSYWFPQNCADVAAAWFEELGCDVGLSPIRLGLTVAQP